MKSNTEQNIHRSHFDVMNNYLTEAGFSIDIKIAPYIGAVVILYKKDNKVFESLPCLNVQAAYEELTGFILPKAYEVIS